MDLPGLLHWYQNLRNRVLLPLVVFISSGIGLWVYLYWTKMKAKSKYSFCLRYHSVWQQAHWNKQCKCNFPNTNPAILQKSHNICSGFLVSSNNHCSKFLENVRRKNSQNIHVCALPSLNLFLNLCNRNQGTSSPNTGHPRLCCASDSWLRIRTATPDYDHR